MWEHGDLINPVIKEFKDKEEAEEWFYDNYNDDVYYLYAIVREDNWEEELERHIDRVQRESQEHFTFRY